MHRVKNLLASVTIKVALAVTAMGATTAAALLIGYVIVANISGLLASFAEERVPEVRRNAELMVAANAVLENVKNISSASDSAELGAQEAAMSASLDALEGLAGSLADPDAAASFAATAQSMRGNATDLAAARGGELDANVRIEAMLADVTEKSAAISGRLAEIADDVKFEAAIGAEDTIAESEAVLTQLVEVDVANLQTALQIRAEMNLASATAVALTLYPDRAVATILADLGTAAIDRLLADAGELAEVEEMVDYAPAIADVASALQAMFQAGRFDREEALSLRQQGDAALASALDDIQFSFLIRSEESVEANSSAITDMVDVHMRNLRDTAEVDAAARAFMVAALSAAAAPDLDATGSAQRALEAAAARLERLSGNAPELQDQFAELLSVADAENGVAALRARVLASRDGSVEASLAAASLAQDLAAAAQASATAALDRIDASSAALMSDMDASRRQMDQIAAGAVALFVLVMIASFFMIARPIRRLAEKTERLSTGDLGPLGLPAGRSEAGRMAAALTVFRDSLIEKERLETEEAAAREREMKETERRAKEDAERARAEAAREAAETQRAADEERRRHEERREQEAREQAMKEEQEAARRKLEVEEHAKREAMRAAAEAERAEEAARQQHIVNALAEGLKRLAAGDLGGAIDEPFPEAYEPLRIDFNRTLESLASTVASIERSARAINSNATEVGQAAEGLSTQTEQAASTLEQTSNALSSLTKSVADTAKSGAAARQSASSARDDAENASTVVRDAVNAMGSIEDSSMQIGKVSALIEDIAFQTNLLALNAGVEAARAGESGRGFAVVAAEVRALALRASEAVADINELVQNSQTEVDRGVDLVGRTGEALEAILRSVADASSRIDDIASRAVEQAREVGEVNDAVGSLGRATQQNAATAQETFAAGREMQETAHALNRSIAIFSAASGGEANTEETPMQDVA